MLKVKLSDTILPLYHLESHALRSIVFAVNAINAIKTVKQTDKVKEFAYEMDLPAGYIGMEVSNNQLLGWTGFTSNKQSNQEAYRAILSTLHKAGLIFFDDSVKSGFFRDTNGKLDYNPALAKSAYIFLSPALLNFDITPPKRLKAQFYKLTKAGLAFLSKEAENTKKRKMKARTKYIAKGEDIAVHNEERRKKKEAAFDEVAAQDKTDTEKRLEAVIAAYDAITGDTDKDELKRIELLLEKGQLEKLCRYNRKAA